MVKGTKKNAIKTPFSCLLEVKLFINMRKIKILKKNTPKSSLYLLYFRIYLLYKRPILLSKCPIWFGSWKNLPLIWIYLITGYFINGFYCITCSIMEKSLTGLDACPEILLSWFRARNSASFLPRQILISRPTSTRNRCGSIASD